MKGGFTLLEFLLYIGIFGIIVGGMSGLVLTVLLGKAQVTQIQEVVSNAKLVLEKIAFAVRNANGILYPALGATDFLLSLEVSDPARDPTNFDLLDGVIRIQEDAGDPIALTSDEVIVKTFQISHLGPSGTITVTLSLEAKNPGGRREYTFEKTFYTSSTIRKK